MHIWGKSISFSSRFIFFQKKWTGFYHVFVFFSYFWLFLLNSSNLKGNRDEELWEALSGKPCQTWRARARAFSREEPWCPSQAVLGLCQDAETQVILVVQGILIRKHLITCWCMFPIELIHTVLLSIMQINKKWVSSNLVFFIFQKMHMWG